ncbi:MAG: DUF6111 family protein [Rhodospirillales bacterium]|nr:DUF6111 family protein [Rhodospirillales bacterium]
MRWAELALFLSPFVLYAAWRLAAARAQPALLWGAVAAVTVLATATLWFGLARRLERGETYVPAQLEDGRIVPGHGVPAAR